MEKPRTSAEIWIELGYKQAALCNDNSIVYIGCLVAGEGMRLVMTSVYNVLVATKKIIKIEDLPLEEKNTLWIQTKEFANNTLNLPETIRLSKCLYALEYLLQ